MYKHKNNKRKVILIIIFIIVVCIICFIAYNFNAGLDRNKNSFEMNITSMLSNKNSIELKELTPFEWDTMYVISPYVPKEKIFDIIGMKSNIIKSSVSEGTHNIIFINQGKIVCYLYGFPQNYYFDFKIQGEYLKFNNDDIRFKVEYINNIFYLIVDLLFKSP